MPIFSIYLLLDTHTIPRGLYQDNVQNADLAVDRWCTRRTSSKTHKEPNIQISPAR